MNKINIQLVSQTENKILYNKFREEKSLHTRSMAKKKST